MYRPIFKTTNDGHSKSKLLWVNIYINLYLKYLQYNRLYFKVPYFHLNLSNSI